MRAVERIMSQTVTNLIRTKQSAHQFQVHPGAIPNRHYAPATPMRYQEQLLDDEVMGDAGRESRE